MLEPTILAPSAFGFRNIRPKTREERLSVKDKVSLEKARLNARVGHEARMHQANAPESSAGLTSCPTNAAGYLSNADRFHSDTAGEERQLRMIEIEKRKKVDEFKRQQNFLRDEERFKQMDEKKRIEEEYWIRQRELGNKSKKNVGNPSYDIMSQEYLPTPQGEDLKYQDQMVKYRGELRKNALLQRGDCRVPYNIISGEARPPLANPVPAQLPRNSNQYNTDRISSNTPNSYSRR